MPRMTPEASDVLARAMQLSVHERELIIDELVDSLDEESAEEGVEDAWADEIKRRVDEIRSGKAKMIPGEEIERQLAARMRRVRK